MQSCEGASPAGLVSTEFQEWFRLKALPIMRDLASKHFHPGNRAEWFSFKQYCHFCWAVKKDPYNRHDPMFLVSIDSDSRHTMKHWWPKIDSGQAQRGHAEDRRDIPFGQPGHIPIDKKINYIPTAPRVPDCIQFPIESMFATVKSKFRLLAKAYKVKTAHELNVVIKYAFQLAATDELIKNCFRHAEENMRIFSGELEETVTIKGTQFQCTQGNWLPKCRRG